LLKFEDKFNYWETFSEDARPAQKMTVSTSRPFYKTVSTQGKSMLQIHRKHCSYGHLGETIQNVHKGAENTKCRNIKLVFYCSY